MSRSGVISNINQALPTNGNDEISASDLRGVLITDIANEFMNLEDDAEIPVYNSSESYKTGKLVLNQGVFWRAVANVLATQSPPTLPTVSNFFWQIQGLNIPFDYANLLNKPNLSLKADLVGGLVPTSQLPSFVDDVLEFANLASFPVTGETGKIYVAINTNRSYRWSGSSYVLIISLDECLQTDVQNESTTASNVYVSPRRFWQGITRFLALAWTFALKITFTTAPRFSSTTASKPLKVDANKDVVSGDITNGEMSIMSPNSVKLNSGSTSSQPQDFTIPANTMLGRLNGFNNGDITGLPILNSLSGTATLVEGTVRITNLNITTSSYGIVTCSTTGICTSDIKYTANAGNMVFSTGQVGDTAVFGFLIFF